MPTLYLHIGTPKTGTTSIQNLMAGNAAILEKYNICYPDPGFRYAYTGVLRNGHFLVEPYVDADGRLHRNLPCGDYETGLDRLQELGKSYETIVLSDEGIFHNSQHRGDFWEKLKSDLEKRGIALKVILYLRRQDLLAQAVYAQRIKWFHIHDPFDVFLDSLRSTKPLFPFDYCAYLDALSAVLGADSLIVRVFEREQFLGAERNLYSDFLQIFGRTLADGFSVKQEMYNTRLDGGPLELKRVLNYLPFSRPEHHMLLHVMEEIQDISYPGYDPSAKYTYFRPGEQKKFLDSFAESNSRLARTYLHRADGVLFREALVEYPQFCVSDRELLNSLTVVYGKALENLSQQNRALVRQNRELSQTVRKLDAEVKSLRENVLLYRLKRKAGHLFGRSGGEKPDGGKNLS